MTHIFIVVLKGENGGKPTIAGFETEAMALGHIHELVNTEILESGIMMNEDVLFMEKVFINQAHDAQT